VESTTLSSISYDSGSKLLELEFANASVYRYLEVPAEVHAELLTARSKGRFFNQRIRGHFAYQRNATGSPVAAK
jgi:lysyl-tRNA synthetase class 2